MDSIFLDVLIIFISIFGLWGGAVWVVNSASRMAKRLGMSDLVIGLTIVAIATSAPEFAVTVRAALLDKAGISIGNVVGSNFFNLYFILGLVAIFGIIKTDKKLVYRDGGVLILSSLLLLLFLSDGYLSRIEGIILMTGLVSYVAFLILKKEPPEEIHPSDIFKWYHILQFIAGIAIIVLSGDFLVDSASKLALYFGISEWVIGLTIVAAGTSLPELATSLVAIGKGNVGLSAGNLIGSNIFNLFGVLGLAGTIKPLQMDPGSFPDIILLALSIILVVIFMRTGWRISRFEGGLLFAAVLVKWGFDLFG